MAVAQNSRFRTFLFICNMLATLVLLVSLVVSYALPQYLPRLHLTPVDGQMLNMQLVSLLLLLAYLQRNLTGGWRIFALASAFVVLVESWLIALA